MATKKRRLTISLDEKIFEILDIESKKSGLNKSAFLTTLILEKKKGV